MIYIAKDVAAGIRELRKKPEVEQWAEAISKIPGVDVYARSVADGLTSKANPEAEMISEPTKRSQSFAAPAKKHASAAKSSVKSRRRP